MATEHGSQDDISRRATRSGVQGYSAETDDWLHDIEHEELRIDPNREVGGGRGSASPMMMPPMMGAGGGAGAGGMGAGAMGPGAGGLGAAGVGGFGPAARAGTLAGGAPMGTTPAGVGGGGLGGGGLGGGGLGGGTFAASSAAGGAGVDTDGDGVADTFAAGGIDTDGDGIPDRWSGGGIDTDGDGIPDRWPGGDHTSAQQPPVSQAPSGGDPSTGPGDIDVDQGKLTNGAKEWAEMSERMAAVLHRASSRAAATHEFGFVTGPHQQYNEMTGAITAWSTSATSEFSLISDNLVADMQAYRQTEDANAAQTAAITKEWDA